MIEKANIMKSHSANCNTIIIGLTKIKSEWTEENKKE